MPKTTWTWILAIACATIWIGVLVLSAHKHGECEALGGKMVREVFDMGGAKCMKVEPIKKA